MLRSAEQIISQSAELNELFAAKYYEIAARRQRGISYHDNFNVDFILLQALEENAIFDTLSTSQVNNIIDALI